MIHEKHRPGKVDLLTRHKPDSIFNNFNFETHKPIKIVCLLPKHPASDGEGR